MRSTGRPHIPYMPIGPPSSRPGYKNTRKPLVFVVGCFRSNHRLGARLGPPRLDDRVGRHPSPRRSDSISRDPFLLREYAEWQRR
ncbi:hypothetical protein OPV22_003439 [Ensete ventricosum]|uniref:Uncharacterized protein n=1 Tax=Ensete ventricosum TaxID=4639 RepID=A0AAV8S0V4_ENSVE|nr:hypothetical protein OPV22_003439 [Ensete ventricosum]